MSGIATAIVASTVLSSSAASKSANAQAGAARDAAAAQSESTQASNQLQWDMYRQNMANQQPYLQAGQMGLAALQGALFGTGNNLGITSGASGASGTSTGTSGTQSSSNFVNNPTTNYGATQAELNAASNAFSGSLGKNFTAADLKTNLAPNYDFQLQQGLQALKSSMAATGQLQTGQGLKNINDYAQNQASGAYQQAFNNWNTQQNQLYNRLQGLISPGSNAASAAGSVGTSTGANIANTTMAGTAASNNYLTSAAAANAAGTVGATNAITGGLNAGMTYLNMPKTNSQLYNLGSPGSTGSSGLGLTVPTSTGTSSLYSLV